MYMHECVCGCVCGCMQMFLYGFFGEWVCVQVFVHLHMRVCAYFCACELSSVGVCVHTFVCCSGCVCISVCALECAHGCECVFSK